MGIGNYSALPWIKRFIAKSQILSIFAGIGKHISSDVLFSPGRSGENTKESIYFSHDHVHHGVSLPRVPNEWSPERTDVSGVNSLGLRLDVLYER